MRNCYRLLTICNACDVGIYGIRTYICITFYVIQGYVSLILIYYLIIILKYIFLWNLCTLVYCVQAGTMIFHLILPLCPFPFLVTYWEQVFLVPISSISNTENFNHYLKNSVKYFLKIQKIKLYLFISSLQTFRTQPVAVKQLLNYGYNKGKLFM